MSTRQVTVDQNSLQDLVDFASRRWDDMNQQQRYALDDLRYAAEQQSLPRQEIPGQQQLFNPED